MESRINLIIDDIEKLFQEFLLLNSQIELAKNQNKKGEVQKLTHTKKYLYRKLFSLKTQFRDLIHGCICNIKYEYYDKESHLKIGEAILLNLSDQEILSVLKLYCNLKALTFKDILEIQRVPTKLN